MTLSSYNVAKQRIQEFLNAQAGVHCVDCWSAVSWLGRRGLLQLLGVAGFQTGSVERRDHSAAELCDDSQTVIRSSWAG